MEVNFDFDNDDNDIMVEVGDSTDFYFRYNQFESRKKCTCIGVFSTNNSYEFLPQMDSFLKTFAFFRTQWPSALLVTVTLNFVDGFSFPAIVEGAVSQPHMAYNIQQ